jgi:hypothetical protein
MGDLFSNLCEGYGWETIQMNYMGHWSHGYVFFPIGWKRCGSEEAFGADSFSDKSEGLRKQAWWFPQ